MPEMVKSPLRYPGRKNSAVKLISKLIPDNIVVRKKSKLVK